MGIGKIAGAITTCSMACVPFDLTGTALVLSGLGATVTTVAAGRKATKKVLEKAKERSDNIPSNLNEADKNKYRTAIWRVSAAATGLTVTGPMALFISAYSIPLLMSMPVFIKEVGEIRKLARKAGGHRELMKSMSKADIAINSILGVAVKGTLLFFIVGDDFETTIKSISAWADDPSQMPSRDSLPDNSQLHGFALDVVEERRNETGGMILEATTKLADLPGDAAKYLVHVDENPLWGDEEPFVKSGLIGMALAATDQLAKKVIEDPAQRHLNTKRKV